MAALVDAQEAARERSWTTMQAVISAFVVLASSAFVLWQLHPNLLFMDSTATGGDTGAHVWAPSYLRDELLPNFRLSGWTPDWYAGFPAYQFYFVVPALLIVGLSYLIPYTIAFKVVTALGVLSVPVGAWAFGRLSRMPFPVPPVLAAFSLFFLFDTSFTIYGGNIPSTLAGEYSFSLSLAISLVFLGMYARGMQDGRHRPVTALLLALTGLTHLLPVFFALVGMLAIGVAYGSRETKEWYASTVVAAVAAFGALKVTGSPTTMAVVAGGILALFMLSGRARAWHTLTMGAVSGMLAAFWVVPFALRVDMTNDMGFERLDLCRHATDYRFGGACDFDSTWMVDTVGLFGGPITWMVGLYRELLGGALLPDGSVPWGRLQNLQWFLALAIVGFIVSLLNRRRAGVALGLIAVLFAGAFLVVGQGQIWNARLLPFWYLSIYLLAAIGVAEVGRSIAVLISTNPLRPIRAVSGATPVLALAAVVVILGPGLLVPQFGRWDGEKAEYAWQPTLEVGPATFRWPGEIHVPGDQRHFVPDWSRWNYRGYENKCEDLRDGECVGYDNYEEYYRVVTMMAEVGETEGCGRTMWEHESDNNRFGTTMAFMLLPYWTDGCIGSMEGLFFESSATTPYHFLNQGILSAGPSNPQRGLPYEALNVDKGVKYLQNLGVRYYLAFSPAARQQADANPDLTRLATTPHKDPAGEGKEWAVYRVADSDIVVGLENQPAVVEGFRQDSLLKGESWDREAWLEHSVDWYQDESAWDVQLAASGPDAWPRVAEGEEPERNPIEPAVVSDVVIEPQAIAFRVDRTGSPVLVRTSYFPNWKVDGADGPYRVAPNLMVVVPTSEEVELTYGYTRVELLAWALTIAGFAGLWFLLRLGPSRLPHVRAEAEDQESLALAPDGTSGEAPPDPDRWRRRELYGVELPTPPPDRQE